MFPKHRGADHRRGKRWPERPSKLLQIRLAEVEQPIPIQCHPASSETAFANVQGKYPSAAIPENAKSKGKTTFYWKENDALPRLRVRPETSGRIAEFSEHEAD